MVICPRRRVRLLLINSFQGAQSWEGELIGQATFLFGASFIKKIVYRYLSKCLSDGWMDG